MRPELLLLVAVALTACDGDTTDGNKTAGPPDDTTTTQSPTPPPEPTVARSHKALVRFKRDVRLRNDFAQALGLEPDELCTELGLYDCVDDVHGVALGGLRPYDLGINEPAPDTGATAPLVVERIAINGCALRTERDFDDLSNALIWHDLAVDEVGLLEDVNAIETYETLRTLYRRALLRDPTLNEIGHHVNLYEDLASESLEPARDWATLSCFAVLTTTESLFY